MNSEQPRLRLGVLGIVILSLFSTLLARLWYLQVLESPELKVRAEGNRVRLVAQPAPRGRILDRTGQVLVDNRVSDVVTVDRSRLDQRKQGERAAVIRRLAALLDRPEDPVTVEVLEQRLADVRYSRFKPVPVAEDVPEPVIVYIREHQELFPAVEAIELAVRSYPHGTLAPHVLGYVGEINGKELEPRRARGYRLGDDIGKSGVELTYEPALRGEPGIEKLEVDSLGRVLRPLGHQEPVQGNDLVLTLDLATQRVAEESLAQGLLRARRQRDQNGKGRAFVAPAGSVVVLDPRDGSLLAMASHPAFDPAQFVNGISQPEFAELQRRENHYPLNNRAIQGLYAPGSTFKLVSAITGLTRGLIAGNTTFLDEGSVEVGNQRFRNAGERRYGRVNVSSALTVSSDVFFYILGARFWEQRRQYGLALQDQARELGLGATTGIALPFEAAGRVPDPENRRQLHEQYPKLFPEGRWFAGDNVNLAIGQGELVVTPLQLANAYAAFANRGTLFQPRTALRVLEQDGTTVEELAPSPIRQLSLSPGVWDPIMQGLRGVISSSKGTAAHVFGGMPPGFAVAGKTGTAQVHGKQDTSVFVAVAPAADPQYVVAVVLEEAGFGASAAAPVARRILQHLAGSADLGDISLLPAVEAVD
jgi:penicillin-binding protein 2